MNASRPRLVPCALLCASTMTLGHSASAQITAASPTVAFAAAAFSAVPSAGAVTITVNRSGDPSSPVIATYTTIDGTAVAGNDYGATLGTLSWTSGDATPKSFVVPIASADPGNRSFSVALLSASGASFGTPINATVSINAAAAAAPGGSGVPAPAAAVDYTTQTLGPAVTMGSNWYNFNFYGRSGVGGTQNSDGSVSIPGTGAAAICTAIQDATKPNRWAGTAFGGGGYFEGTFSFTGADDSSLSVWPAFWANDIENMSQNAVTALTQWPGQPTGYGNWVETDFFEYDHHSAGQYGIQIHDWYGDYGSQGNVTAFDPGVNVPAGFDWSTPHKYGFLWVPATANTMGYAEMFLDDVQVGPTVHWDQYHPASPSPPPPVNGSTAVSILDTRHLAMIFDTGTHNPMTVYAVSVWQASSADNITQ